MKRVGYLADKVFTRENVRAAWDAYNKNRPVKLRKARIAAKAWLAGMGCEIKDDWQVFPTASRRVKICGFALHAARPPRLYRRIWRRTRRAFCVFAAHPTKRLYLSLMSRKGWLMAINKHFSPAFKLPNGGYLWQAK